MRRSKERIEYELRGESPPKRSDRRAIEKHKQKFNRVIPKQRREIVSQGARLFGACQQHIVLKQDLTFAEQMEYAWLRGYVAATEDAMIKAKNNEHDNKDTTSTDSVRSDSGDEHDDSRLQHQT